MPLRVYFKDGRAKVELALAKGKRAYDKRQALAERDAKRETERAMKGATRVVGSGATVGVDREGREDRGDRRAPDERADDVVGRGVRHVSAAPALPSINPRIALHTWLSGWLRAKGCSQPGKVSTRITDVDTNTRMKNGVDAACAVSLSRTNRPIAANTQKSAKPQTSAITIGQHDAPEAALEAVTDGDPDDGDDREQRRLPQRCRRSRVLRPLRSGPSATPGSAR